MFTTSAFFMVGVLSWYAGRMNAQDRRDATLANDGIQSTVSQTRQDIKLIAFLLAGVIVMLGIIADRIH